MPTHFLFTNIFPKKTISETQKGSSTKCFGTVRWNHFDAQSWRPPPFLSLLFFVFKKIWNTEMSLYEKFRYYETKKVDGESWCLPTFFSLTISDIKRILKHRRVHLRNVWVLWDKNFQRKIVKPLPLLCKKNFDCKTSETQKGSPRKIFGTVSRKNWRGSLCPPPLFTSTFFNIKNFLKHRRFPLRNVSPLRNKHFRRTVVMPRLFISSKFSPSGEISEAQKGSLTNSFGIVKQNSLTENRDTPPLFMHEKFRC